jgi:hypothetical protein
MGEPWTKANYWSMKKMNAIEVEWNESQQKMNTRKNLTQGIKHSINEARTKQKCRLNQK